MRAPPLVQAAPSPGDGGVAKKAWRHNHIATPDPVETYALGAVATYPAARARMRELGAAPLALFADETAALLADKLIDEDSTVADALAAAGSTPEAMVLLTEALGAVEAMERAGPRGPAWGLRVVERLAEKRAEAIAPITLAWAREAMVKGWTTPARIRAEVDCVLALAAGEGVAA